MAPPFLCGAIMEYLVWSENNCLEIVDLIILAETKYEVSTNMCPKYLFC